MKKIIIIFVLLVVVLIGAISFSGKKSPTDTSTPSTSSGAKAAPQAQEANAIVIKNYEFGPKTMTIKKGTTITWTNQDIARHTVTADTPSPDGPKSDFFGQGEKYTFTFAKAGTYAYHCEPHPYMKASIVVTE